ncbi:MULTISPECIES: hypothetical protein [unclassified Massilia]|uniref:hypothetical protein n=1 Tax=unclassified Massilia TaxID=2609279 RepID=UPI00177BA547|nr:MULTISPECIES: hypothetical protein [unclassified Massilia]MBD8533404.1 hypothetical protein [Massilia sp. CFBP 13647]MBD8676797.1 hypothetical protein [Massilia sp. CFBP 13721]
MDMWSAREASWAYLKAKRPSRLSVFLALIELIDRCVDEYEARSGIDTYARVDGLTLLKAKNLALGSFSLLLDGLGQEAGALLRPMIEYAELLTYFRHFPEKTEQATENDLPKAGERAKAIEGIYHGLRRHLNEHASHSSYSQYSLSHLLTRELSFRKMQQFVPEVLDRNFIDLAVQVWLILHEAVLSLERAVSYETLVELASSADKLKARMIHVFELEAA